MNEQEIRNIIADEIKKRLKIYARAGSRQNWHGVGFPAVKVQILWQTEPPDPQKKFDGGKRDVIDEYGNID